MAPSKWDDESDGESSSASPAPLARRGKFDDEEEDSDVLDSWDAAEDSEAEREKAKIAAEVKAKADADAKASKKTKSQRIEEHKADALRRQQELDELSSDEDEDEASRRARMRAMELDTDLAHAEDLFGDLAVGASVKRPVVKPVALADPKDPNNTIDLAGLPLFNPMTKDQFLKLREALVPLLASNSKKAQYTLFMQEFTKQICKDLPSDQIKKIASGLTTLSNEKMKEEKLAEKGGKKSKAAKSKVALKAGRDITTRADVSVYDDDGLGDDDFM